MTPRWPCFVLFIPAYREKKNVRAGRLILVVKRGTQSGVEAAGHQRAGRFASRRVLLLAMTAFFLTIFLFKFFFSFLKNLRGPLYKGLYQEVETWEILYQKKGI